MAGKLQWLAIIGPWRLIPRKRFGKIKHDNQLGYIPLPCLAHESATRPLLAFPRLVSNEASPHPGHASDSTQLRLDHSVASHRLAGLASSHPRRVDDRTSPRHDHSHSVSTTNPRLGTTMACRRRGLASLTSFQKLHFTSSRPTACRRQGLVSPRPWQPCLWPSRPGRASAEGCRPPPTSIQTRRRFTP